MEEAYLEIEGQVLTLVSKEPIKITASGLDELIREGREIDDIPVKNYEPVCPTCRGPVFIAEEKTKKGAKLVFKHCARENCCGQNKGNTSCSSSRPNFPAATVQDTAIRSRRDSFPKIFD